MGDFTMMDPELRAALKSIDKRFDKLDYQFKNLREDVHLIKTLLGIVNIDLKTLRPAVFADQKHLT